MSALIDFYRDISRYGDPGAQGGALLKKNTKKGEMHTLPYECSEDSNLMGGNLEGGRMRKRRGAGLQSKASAGYEHSALFKGAGLQSRGSADYEHAELFGGSRRKKRGAGLQSRGSADYEHAELFGGSREYDRNNLYGGNIFNEPKKVAELLSKLLKSLLARKDPHADKSRGAYEKDNMGYGSGYASAGRMSHKRKGSGFSSAAGLKKKQKQARKHESAGASAWQNHVHAYRQKHPGISFKEALQGAAKTY